MLRKLVSVMALMGLALVASAQNGPDSPQNLFAIPVINIQYPDQPQIDLTWLAPSSGPTPTAYKVYINGKLIETTTFLVSQIRPLTIGIKYKFSVTAVNPDGESEPIYYEETAQIPPSAPRNPQAVPGDTYIDVSWDVPLDNGGTPIDFYDVFINPSGSTCDMTGPTSCRFSGLTNFQRYDSILIFPRKAVSVMMIGAGSTPEVTTIPRPFPSGPRKFAVAAGGGQAVTLSWGTPLDVGPLPIQGYQISVFGYQGDFLEPEFPLATVTVPPHPRLYNVSNLQAGMSYQFGIQAYTKAGIGGMTQFPLYIQEGIYMPLGKSGAPGGIAVAGMGTNSVKIAWTEPDPNGGAGIKKYRITATPVDINPRLSQKKQDKLIVVKECIAEEPAPECTEDYIVGDLTNGVKYSFTVAAYNRYGWSAESKDIIYATPFGDPNDDTKKKLFAKLAAKKKKTNN